MTGRPLSPMRVLRVASRHPSALLLAAQLLSLLLYPLMEGAHDRRVLFGAFALLVVPLAVWVVSRSRAVNWIAWMLAIPALALSAAAIVFRAGSWCRRCSRQRCISTPRAA